MDNLVIGNNRCDPSAILDLNSDSKGFLPPRIASIDYIKNPVPGLIIYESSTNKLKYYNGKEWINL